jgi:hypothetical protein
MTSKLPQENFQWSHELPTDRAEYVWDVDIDGEDFDPEDLETWMTVRVAPARCLGWDQQLTGGPDFPLGASLEGLRESCEATFEVDTRIRTLDELRNHMTALGFVYAPGVFGD